MVMLYDTDITRAGVQICNVEDRKSYKSNIVSHTITTDGINNVTYNPDEIISTAYYDTSGRRTSRPHRHISIRVEKDPHGTSPLCKTIR